MERISIDGFEFLKNSIGKANIFFSTAKDNINFNIREREGINNILKIKKLFGLKDIGFLNQIHSNIIHIYDENRHDGDSIITDRKKTAVGVFTADCVPIIIYDKDQEIISAVHSGWKGTLGGIVMNTITKMHQEYGSNSENLIVYIGPHIKECCYEIGDDVADLFTNNEMYSSINPIINSRLNLEKCILEQLRLIGIPKHNINTLNCCTFCDENIQLHSYRKLKNSAGRMFSFIYLD